MGVGNLAHSAFSHTTLESGISSDASRGLAKQGTHCLQEIKWPVHFVPFLFRLLTAIGLDAYWGGFLPAQGGSTDIFPFNLLPTPKTILKVVLVAQASENIVRISVGP